MGKTPVHVDEYWHAYLDISCVCESTRLDLSRLNPKRRARYARVSAGLSCLASSPWTNSTAHTLRFSGSGAKSRFADLSSGPLVADGESGAQRYYTRRTRSGAYVTHAEE